MCESLLLLTHWRTFTPAAGGRSLGGERRPRTCGYHLFALVAATSLLFIVIWGSNVWWCYVLQLQQIWGNTGAQKLCSTHIQDLQGQIPKINQNLGFISFIWLHLCLPGLCSAVTLRSSFTHARIKQMFSGGSYLTIYKRISERGEIGLKFWSTFFFSLWSNIGASECNWNILSSLGKFNQRV